MLPPLLLSLPCHERDRSTWLELRELLWGD
jgi:hypothetical protein